MTIYNFNRGIGWASSGVEYAQAYRANIFRKNKQNAKFIFTDMFHENLQPMIKNIGFSDKEIIWMYQYFTNIKVCATSYSVEQFETSFTTTPTKIEKEDLWKKITYTFQEKGLVINAYLDKNETKDVIYKTEIIINGNLTRRDYYTSVRLFSEYFKPINKAANIYQRRFFNRDGTIAYEELINGEQSLFIFKDRTIYSKEELICYFIEQLQLKSDDILLIDRSTGMGPQIIKSKGEAKVGVIIHAEHFNEPLTTNKYILWNNFYDYQFQNAKSIDFFVTATQAQKELIEQQFEYYNKGKIKIYVVPVGSLDRLEKSRKRKKHSLITASRLAGEKHIDWLIKATAIAKETIEDLTLDIYGKGSEEEKLRHLITSLGAEEYIKLKGQQDLTLIYKKYGTYVSTSTSEGFGLTLMEATGSGLGLIGFDVRYGNQTFINHGDNGILVNYNKYDSELNVLEISKAICKLLSMADKRGQTIQQNSYRIAEYYLTSNIQKLWKKLEREVNND